MFSDLRGMQGCAALFDKAVVNVQQQAGLAAKTEF
jgi:hypothetical protein